MNLLVVKEEKLTLTTGIPALVLQHKQVVGYANLIVTFKESFSHRGGHEYCAVVRLLNNRFYLLPKHYKVDCENFYTHSLVIRIRRKTPLLRVFREGNEWYSWNTGGCLSHPSLPPLPAKKRLKVRRSMKVEIWKP